MFGFIRKIKEMYSLSQRIAVMESGLKEFEVRIAESINNYSDELDKKIKQISRKYFDEFETKVQNLSFSYTKNLDDSKSEYLKRYLETRLDCMSESIRTLPSQIAQMKSNLVCLEDRLSELDGEHDY